MAWDTVLVDILRYIINDINSTSWTDTQLKKFLTIATVFVDSDVGTVVDNGGPYTVDTIALTITPDPTEFSSIYSMLIVLKASCIIARAELKAANAMGGWKIIDDRSTIDGTQGVKSAKELASSACQDYEEAKNAYLYGQIEIALAILSPYSNGNLDTGYGGGDNCRWR